MRVKIAIIAGLGVALASCGHHSSSSSSSTGTAQVTPTAPKTAPTTSTAGITPGVTNGPTSGYPVSANGLGIVAPGGVPAQVSLTGTVKETTVMTGPAPITFVTEGDPALKGTLMSSSRTNNVDSNTRFLMSDQSTNSKDAPTAFGILSNKSTDTQFAAAGYYGGVAATNIPTTGTATYNGTYAGVTATGADRAKGSGDLALTADFGAGKVKGDISNIQSGTAVAAGQASRLSFTSTMSGDKASFATGNGDAITATVGGVDKTVAGSAAGGFYGAGASETAGAITTFDGGASTVGAFYGKKQ